MPASVEAAAIFSLLIVPGYSFLAGYRLGRSHTLPEKDLYVHVLPPQGPSSGASTIKTVDASRAIAKLKGIKVSEAAQLFQDADDEERAGPAPAAHA